MSGTAGPHVHSSLPSDLSASVFFKIEDMKPGKTMKMYFLKKEPSSSRLFPREKAESIPFSTKQLPYLLDLFSFPRGSPQAHDVEATLKLCESRPNKREVKNCATSMEAMLDFVLGVFQISEPTSRDHPTMLTTILHSRDKNPIYQNYTAIGSPQEVVSSRVIGCHTVGYPYTVFYCHSQEGGDKVYKIPFLAENGDKLDAYSICHQDTSEWDPNHVSFRALGGKPGSRVCHIFPPFSNFIWVHSPTTAASI